MLFGYGFELEAVAFSRFDRVYWFFWFFSLGLTVCIKVYAGSKLGLASSVTLAFLCVYVTGLEFRGLV